MNIFDLARARILAGGGSGGGGGDTVPVKAKGVNFYDYDGTLLHSYTVEEAQALIALPKLPTREGLICQGWNYDLETIKSYNRKVNVGATYITDDGKTRLYIKIAAEGRMKVPLYFQQTVENGVTIDWGDGSATETLSGTGKVKTTHTYASIGEYVISLDVMDGCTLGLGYESSTYCVMGATNNNGKVYCNMLQKVEIGKCVTSLGVYTFNSCYTLKSVTIPHSVTSLGGNAFQACYSLASVVIPNSVTSSGSYTFNGCYSLANVVIPHSVTKIDGYTFQDCRSLVSVVIPIGVTAIDTYAFNTCYALASVVIPRDVTSLGNYAFQDCRSLTNVVIPHGVTSLGNYAFNGCTGVKFYDFTSHTAVPTLGGTIAFGNIPSDGEIRVPEALYDEWIAAKNWSTYASNIISV